MPFVPKKEYDGVYERSFLKRPHIGVTVPDLIRSALLLGLKVYVSNRQVACPFDGSSPASGSSGSSISSDLVMSEFKAARRVITWKAELHRLGPS